MPTPLKAQNGFGNPPDKKSAFPDREHLSMPCSDFQTCSEGTRCRHRVGAPLKYNGPMSGRRLPGGVVHKLPADLREALIANGTALDAWKDITPLARNEFICWVEDAKQATTRERRIRRTQEELEEGQRRPCCWPGCKHRERIGT
jgi:hypothetical protein